MRYKFGQKIKIGKYNAIVVRDYGETIAVVYDNKSDPAIYNLWKKEFELKKQKIKERN